MVLVVVVIAGGVGGWRKALLAPRRVTRFRLLLATTASGSIRLGLGSLVVPLKEATHLSFLHQVYGPGHAERQAFTDHQPPSLHSGEAIKWESKGIYTV